MFQENNDVISWMSKKNGIFTVKSVYNALTLNETGNNYRMLWEGRITAKIKILLWLLKNNAVLTKDNLIKRQRHVTPSIVSVTMMKL